jgi:enoyl-CoA hydratase/carnithine racemase
METENMIEEVQGEVRGKTGFITLNRPRALNALSLAMVRELARLLTLWRDDRAVEAVAVRGMSKAGPSGSQEGPFGAFCAGGDIRFFHEAAHAGNPALEDFFTEEYALNHLIHTYPKPYVAFMDGIVMGGGMGISQGASLRIVTERTKMAMPETNIGLFPDVGGGYFLSRVPGHLGEWLALTGHMLDGEEAVALGLADVLVEPSQLPELWERMVAHGAATLPHATKTGASGAILVRLAAQFNEKFALGSALEIVRALEADPAPDSQAAAQMLRKRSPLMLEVVLQQIRRGRHLGLADDLRMERGMVHRCFHLRPGAASETVEGIRALAVDKDHAPKWNPARIEDVTPAMVAPFFESPWAAQEHPLRDLA